MNFSKVSKVSKVINIVPYVTSHYVTKKRFIIPKLCDILFKVEVDDSRILDKDVKIETKLGEKINIDEKGLPLVCIQTQDIYCILTTKENINFYGEKIKINVTGANIKSYHERLYLINNNFEYTHFSVGGGKLAVKV
jgi:hypothetical protein